MRFVDHKFVFPLQPVSCHETGPANLAEQTFKGNIFASIAREAIQNSLDASRNNGRPVEVKFAYKCVDLEKNHDFDNILNSAQEHIHLCAQKYHDQPQQRQGFTDMLNTITRFRRLGKLPYFEISDYETIGMYFDIANPAKGRMCSFMHEDGEHYGRGSQGGGANGIGKTAYFSMSPLRMVLASTHAIPSDEYNDEEAKSFFSGTIKLVTHPNPHDTLTKFQYAGYFPEIPLDKPYWVLEDASILPFRLNRCQGNGGNPRLGTSFFIIGCEPKGISKNVTRDNYEIEFEECANNAYLKDMLPSILRNYFAAINSNKLKITLGINNRLHEAIEVNSITVEDKIKSIDKFKDDLSVKVSNPKDNLNPTYFLKALADVVGGDEDDIRVRHYELDLDKVDNLNRYDTKGMKWGKVKLFLYIDSGLSNNMIVCMRAPLMTVSRFKIDNSRGQYAGVLIADQEGNFCNQILRACEPADHASWKATNADTLGHGESPEAADALLKVIEQWVNQNIIDLFPQNNENEIFDGMRQYLSFYDPADPSQRNSDLNKPDVKQDETTTIKIKRADKNKSKGSELGGQNQKKAEDGDGDFYAGGTGGSGGGDDSGTKKPTRKKRESDDGKTQNVVKKANVRFRSFAKYLESEMLWEHIIVLSGVREDFDSVALQLRTQGENSKEPLVVDSAWNEDGSRLRVSDTIISGIKIGKAESKKIRVRFQLSSKPFSLSAVSTIEAAYDERDKKILTNK